MDNDPSILDKPDVSVRELEDELLVQRRKHFKYALILIAVNIGVSFFARTNGLGMDTVIIGMAFGFNIIAALIAAVVAIFPYKHLSYDMRYKRATLLCVLAVQGLLFVAIMFNLAYKIAWMLG